jgi:hypothetical protein
MWMIVGIPLAVILLLAGVVRLLNHDHHSEKEYDADWWWRIK